MDYTININLKSLLGEVILLHTSFGPNQLLQIGELPMPQKVFLGDLRGTMRL